MTVSQKQTQFFKVLINQIQKQYQKVLCQIPNNSTFVALSTVTIYPLWCASVGNPGADDNGSDAASASPAIIVYVAGDDPTVVVYVASVIISWEFILFKLRRKRSENKKD